MSAPAAPATGEVSVNGVAVDVAAFAEPGGPRPRASCCVSNALATGLLAGDADAGEIDGAIERLLEREVTHAEAEYGRVPPRYYDAHPELFVQR